MKPARKNLLLILAVLLWVAALLAALWWYQARYLRAFDEQAALFDSSALQLPGGDQLAQLFRAAVPRLDAQQRQLLGQHAE